jgi:hypothetical protein
MASQSVSPDLLAQRAIWDAEAVVRSRLNLIRTRARYKHIEKVTPAITYTKVEGLYHSRPGENTYQVLQSDKPIGYVGMQRRESWRKHGRIRTSLIGLTRDWWSGSQPSPGSRDQIYSDYSHSRQAATTRLLEYLWDLAHPEPSEEIS